MPFRWTCRYRNRVTGRRDEFRLESRAVDSARIRRSVAGNPAGRAIATSLLVALVNASILVSRVPLFRHPVGLYDAFVCHPIARRRVWRD